MTCNGWKLIKADDAEKIARAPCYTLPGMDHIVAVAHNSRKNCRMFDVIDRSNHSLICQIDSGIAGVSAWFCGAARGRDLPFNATA